MYPRNNYLGQTEYFEPEKPEPTWWETAWGGVEKALKVGTETFKAVAPYTLKPKGITPIYGAGITKLPATQQGLTYQQQQVLQDLERRQQLQQLLTAQELQQLQQLRQQVSPYIVTAGGQVVRRSAPTQATNMLMPIALGFGAILLFTTMGKRRKR